MADVDYAIVRGSFAIAATGSALLALSVCDARALLRVLAS